MDVPFNQKTVEWKKERILRQQNKQNTSSSPYKSVCFRKKKYKEAEEKEKTEKRKGWGVFFSNKETNMKRFTISFVTRFF